ncbi:uncharacterized protein LOC130648107 [Hydractinia symbiolongicarpus]|uniref:uncharacterized protein LOC130648107 n=1 Tax=Hydractinia symbiolongicarpus TaxID=13093 RepID=UPI00255028BB|nr:uncharacterized protein LOC130648107 [Hydractinia symbiolongicarpus]
MNAKVSKPRSFAKVKRSNGCRVALKRYFIPIRVSVTRYANGLKPCQIKQPFTIVNKKHPTFMMNEDPKVLVQKFVEQLEQRQIQSVKEVEKIYPKPDDFDMLPEQTQNAWHEWVNQVTVIGFNSGKYDINMIKRYFVERIADDDNIKVAKKDNEYMILTTSNFKFIAIKNFLAPDLSYEKCALSGRNTLSPEDYQAFRDEFYKRECVTMLDWLTEYNMADVIPFIEAVDRTRNTYYRDEIDILKDAVSIPGVSMWYVLNKSLRLNPDKKLYASGDFCKHKCEARCTKARCEYCKQVQNACTICTKNEAYELLQTGMVGGPAIVFCRYHENDVTGIRSHIYTEPKKCKTILGYDANMLYPTTLLQDFPCGKEKMDRCSGLPKLISKSPPSCTTKISEMSPLFVVKEISDKAIPDHMRAYLTKTGRKRIPGTRKLLGVMRAKKILLCTDLVKWYLEHGLKITACYQLLKYSRGKPFAWFAEEIADARRQADKDPDTRIAGDTAKLKGNSFYGKMIEDLARHNNTTFTKDEKVVDAAMRSPYLEDLEEIADAYEVRRSKQGVSINRAYQCGIYVYQLAKLRMLEFYYDFLDRYVDRQNYEYVYMDTDSAYFAISGDNLRDVVRPELIKQYDEDVKNWLVIDKYSSRTGGLFKEEFIDSRMIALTAKCYFVQW